MRPVPELWAAYERDVRPMRAINRKGMRHRLTLPATICANNGQPVCDCRTWDWSEQGARLEVAAPLDLPETFNLTLSGDESRRCTIVWRSEHCVGVVFPSD